jgi:butyryl-CoA dehydrogenase
MSYRAPVADILYSLKHVAGFAAAVEAGRFGDLDLETAESVIGEAGKFATEALAPLDVVGDREGARCANGVVTTPTGFRDAYRRWAEAGWAGVTASPQYGGMGLPHAVAAACNEMWSGASMGFALCPLLGEGAIGERPISVVSSRANGPGR